MTDTAADLVAKYEERIAASDEYAAQGWKAAEEAMDGWSKSSAAYNKLIDAGVWLMAMAGVIGLMTGICIACVVAEERFQWNLVYVMVPLLIAGLLLGRKADKIVESIDP